MSWSALRRRDLVQGRVAAAVWGMRPLCCGRGGQWVRGWRAPLRARRDRIRRDRHRRTLLGEQPRSRRNSWHLAGCRTTEQPQSRLAAPRGHLTSRAAILALGRGMPRRGRPPSAAARRPELLLRSSRQASGQVSRGPQTVRAAGSTCASRALERRSCQRPCSCAATVRQCGSQTETRHSLHRRSASAAFLWRQRRGRRCSFAAAGRGRGRGREGPPLLRGRKGP